MSGKQVDSVFGVTDSKIQGFFRQYRNLSNFGEGKVHYEGLVYPNREAAYQAAKSTSFSVRKHFTTLSASDAKKEGILIALRPGWDKIKVSVMTEICRDAFNNNDFLKELLLSTGEKYLEETNWWKDIYWGVYNGIGENNLGKILMSIRDEIKSQSL